ncbi:lantibiotic immunity ABC transporter MutE/EpiE family permease subunit [Clostridium saccharobutylicum]|uniref:Lantibiotic permease protein spaE/mutE n=1 Tax=Clostridium saccharobutylicum DSM 13864 TaxID=1345695 RepID=U5MVR5_CLOSA|nr:lantibiotic immunity ABC transporter MutE/EpiE family permease subunit [Clostridium saccharobutylicum]AGX44633.1 lantibiotic permease protein spaE/mutE [Clostridium saccharobutylicum DSM 13864]AQR91921.1 ABC-2 family transporter protein [Clostridium saccharobutylicum]AQS01823.1 ABC-2 family transporter protein [Clostridium saccharobutylicum]AQS15806.1 ABC-2 family transporter protein [Clostridium saccharobutylicum]MBA2903409.1 ABC-2 type transport system permease protein [Clostridium saccha
MIKYFVSENLKIKNTFLNKFIFIMPILTIIFTLLLEPTALQKGSYNFWYIFIYPGTVTLISTLLSRVDGKIKNKSVLSLPLDLSKVWISKILIGIKSIFISCLVLFFAVQIIPIIYSNSFQNAISFLNGFIAIIILVITFSWQIPLWIYLGNKIGLFITTIISIIVNFLSSVIAVKNLWWICPFTYPSRLMCPILKILPNGLPATPGSVTFTPEFLNILNIPLGIALSIILFCLVTYLTANWYKSQEV